MGAMFAQIMDKLTEVTTRLDKVESSQAPHIDIHDEQHKGKRVECGDQLPSQPVMNPRNQGALSSQGHHVNHIDMDCNALETTQAISSLRSGKSLINPYKGNSSQQVPMDEEEGDEFPKDDSDESSESEDVGDKRPM